MSQMGRGEVAVCPWKRVNASGTVGNIVFTDNAEDSQVPQLQCSLGLSAGASRISDQQVTVTFVGSAENRRIPFGPGTKAKRWCKTYHVLLSLIGSGRLVNRD